LLNVPEYSSSPKTDTSGSGLFATHRTVGPARGRPDRRRGPFPAAGQHRAPPGPTRPRTTRPRTTRCRTARHREPRDHVRYPWRAGPAAAARDPGAGLLAQLARPADSYRPRPL